MRPVQAVKKNRRLRQPVIVPLQRRGSTMIGRIVTVHARHAVYLLMLSLSVLLAAPTVTGCASSQPDDTVTLRVFAASSLTEALTEAAAAFEAENDGVRIETHFAGSSRLRAQLEEGARADVFISADRRQIDEADDLLIDSSQVTLAANELVVAVRETNGPIQEPVPVGRRGRSYRNGAAGRAGGTLRATCDFRDRRRAGIRRWRARKCSL